ncbi:MAG: DUF2207 domain-containing protein [Hyphomonas sp.]
MIALRSLLLALITALFVLAAGAEERIDRFDVRIDVQTDGDILVTEQIAITAEGREIRRGIFRDLPRYFERRGARIAYRYDVLGVTRNGRAEPYASETDGGAVRIRIGDGAVLLEPGPHTYEIRYRVRNQVRYFSGYDEVYWNATGTYWSFPILAARVSLAFPPGARVAATSGYTGALGSDGADYTYTETDGRHVFETTRRLEAREGLTVAVGIAKGLIDPPSALDEGWMWWQHNGSLVILLVSLAALSWYYVRSFDSVGRDPPKGPVFALYEPPKGYSPAAVHHIYYRGLRGNGALIASLMNLAVKGQVRIDTSEKNVTVLEQTRGGEAPAGISAEEKALSRKLFTAAGRKVLDGKYDAGFTAAYTSLRASLSRKYGRDYFRWNAAYTVAGLLLTTGGLVFAILQATLWTTWHTFAVLALAALNILFLYLMPAPTPKGQKVRTGIEGFRLYMETAEKLQLNAVEVGSEKLPPMSKERYEAFLPYAVALGVEKPWTRHFERLLPAEAESYNPGWAGFSGGGGRSLAGLNTSLISSLNSGVSGALPQSSSSSGSGGGGSSGGGGGGGGGGGW